MTISIEALDAAAEEAPVALVQHLPVVVALVVPAAREVGEEAAGVVVVAWVVAKLRVQGGVHDADVAQVAVQEGEDADALRVGELR